MLISHYENLKTYSFLFSVLKLGLFASSFEEVCSTNLASSEFQVKAWPNLSWLE